MSQVDSVRPQRGRSCLRALSVLSEQRWLSEPLGSAVNRARYGAVTVRVAVRNATLTFLDVGTSQESHCSSQIIFFCFFFLLFLPQQSCNYNAFIYLFLNHC